MSVRNDICVTRRAFNGNYDRIKQGESSKPLARVTFLRAATARPSNVAPAPGSAISPYSRSPSELTRPLGDESPNVGLSFREDIEPRTRRLDLEFFEENSNGRDYKYPDLHGWIFSNRPLVLGAVATIVQHWIQCGCPAGKTPFNSFPEWARVVGGIMNCCGLGDPC